MFLLMKGNGQPFYIAKAEEVTEAARNYEDVYYTGTKKECEEELEKIKEEWSKKCYLVYCNLGYCVIDGFEWNCYTCRSCYTIVASGTREEMLSGLERLEQEELS